MDKLLKSDVNFQRVRDGRNALPFYFDLDLSTARSVAAGTHFIANVAGDSFYADANPIAGNCIVHFQDTNLDRAAVPFYVSPGFIANVPFTQLLIENAAQPGKKIRIVYGVDIDFQPGSVAQIAVSNSGGYTSVRPEAQTGFFQNLAAVAANTPLTVFAPGANPNGVILLQAVGQLIEVANVSGGFIAHTAPPATLSDGFVVAAWKMTNSSGNFNAHIDLQTPVLIPANHGLYYLTTQATTAGQTWRGCRYKIL